MLFVKAVLTLSPLYILTALIIYAGQSKHGEKWRSFLESILNPLPVLGAGRRSLALSRLAMALEALISAGVTVVEAWEFAAVASGSPALRRVIAEWKPQFAAGKTPAELVRSSAIFPEMFANLYHSGEVSGKLDETLQRLYVFYREDGVYKIRMVAKTIPWIIYFAVMLMIAYKIIQFYLGLYGPNSELSNVMNGFNQHGK